MRASTGILAALVIVAAACQLTAAGTVSRDVGGVSVVECGIWYWYCKPTGCTEDGKCIFSNPLCSNGCKKCQCSPYDSYSASETSCSGKSSSLGCSVKGCLQDGTCVMSSWACKQGCECACAITSAADYRFLCKNTEDVYACKVLGCTPDNKCIFSTARCQSECEQDCTCTPEQ